ncbi:Mrp/NBP35 family ATP-binding protein [Rhodocaloribacter litoris]|uniref:Mrp/NBP35 family ATP-binding protein n=1 Tax=Rhodocaloribacter litoris TaxID=2558931 RepID=UPI00141F3C14|nr:Mrp/NBP35 family ATP-binding protein [Rhodocaloribacter litoris]QXD16697.1 Mrp/NBP35 family ATP-binding protein [Rhodocaloribacter litoris]GIV59304.1 MAG: iron-sulfur cluster carrier protein [Rhodothermaceae bacterium]
MTTSLERILDALATVVDPDRGKDIVRLGLVKDLRVEGDTVAFTLLLKNPAAPFARTAAEQARQAVHAALGPAVQVNVHVDNEMIGLGDDLTLSGAETPKAEERPVHTIAVASGKGGVGKSTVAVNLAVALARAGYDVGLVDTDIYGPSIPTMFGLKEARPRVNDARKIIPLEQHGVKLLSMGFLVDPDKAVIWRGPMVSSAVRQFLNDTAWGALDFLVLDLPPGTGDIQLTIVQTVPLSGAIIVSTPQDVALADARKGVAMFEQVNVPVLGLVENMAYFTPPDLPDRKYYLFGEGGARRLAEELGVPLLGEVPIEQSLRESCDAGTPVVLAAPESVSARAFTHLAGQVARQTALHHATLPSTPPVEISYR